MTNDQPTTNGWKRRAARRQKQRALAALLLSFILHPSSFILSAAAADATIAKIEVFPPDFHLNTNRDRQKFVVVATRADGVTQDVTRETQVTLANPALARLDAATLYPLADGE